MPGSGVVLAKNGMMNDGGGHARQITKYEAQSTKTKHCLNPNSTNVPNSNKQEIGQIAVPVCSSNNSGVFH